MGFKYAIRSDKLHFLTHTIVDWIDIFTRRELGDIIVNSLNYCIEKKGLTIFSWCLMTNHLHLIAEAREGYILSHIIRDLKKFTAYTILKAIKEEPESRKDWMLYRFEYAGKFMKRIEKYHFWQDGNHAVYLDPHKPKMMQQRLNYTHENPVRAGIVENAADYLYSSARDYCGGKGLVNIMFV